MNSRISTYFFSLFFASLFLTLMALLYPNVVFAFASITSDNEKSHADFNGALRLNCGYAQNRTSSDDTGNNDFTNTSVLRFITVGTIASRLDFELNMFGVVGSLPPPVGNSITNAALTVSTYRTHWLDRSLNQDSVFGGYGLDSAFVRLNGKRASFAIGRMPLNYAAAALFAVNDFFAPFSASSINTVYKPGVDAVKLAIQTGNLSNVEIVGVMGNSNPHTETGTPSIRASAALIYAHGLAGPVDLGFIAGRLAGKWFIGGSAQGDVGSATLYTEGHVGFRDDDDTTGSDAQRNVFNKQYVQTTLGLRWTAGWRNLSVTLEYAYHSDGVSASNYLYRHASRVYPDEIFLLGKQYGGMAVSMELHPLVYLSGMTQVNLVDHSGLGSLAADINVGDNTEWVAGVLAPFGKSSEGHDGQIQIRSEYGDAPFMAFTELRHYF